MMLKERNKKALKEWAVVVKAMDLGHQIMLVRSGGIMDEEGIFSLESDEFFLFPTFAHQRRNLLKPQYQSALDELSYSGPPPNQILISNYAKVEEAVEIADPAGLVQLSDEYVWTPSFVTERVNMSRDGRAHVLLLRVFRLGLPKTIEVRPEYGGCRSWVDLAEEIPTSGCRPVLSDMEFYHRAGRIKDILKRG